MECTQVEPAIKNCEKKNKDESQVSGLLIKYLQILHSSLAFLIFYSSLASDSPL